MKPVLAEWQQAYAKGGLVIVDIYDGSIDTFDAVRKDVEKAGEKFSVLWDKGGAIHKAYGVEASPAGYLLGVDGTVLWEGVPNAKVKAIEALIQSELAKVKKAE